MSRLLGMFVTIVVGCTVLVVGALGKEPRKSDERERVSKPQTNSLQGTSAIKEVVISLIDADPDVSVELRIRDKTRIDRLVARPLSKALVDREPKKYVVVAEMKISRVDGSQTIWTLFHPWGHLAHDDDYFVADLMPLKKLFFRELKNASENPVFRGMSPAPSAPDRRAERDVDPEGGRGHPREGTKRNDEP